MAARPPFMLILRHGSHVERVRCETLAMALEAMEQRMDELAPLARREAIRVWGRRYQADRQVPVRAELTGPGGLWRRPYGGVDLHGDGRAVAYTGRLRRSVIDLRPGETPYDGLRRVLSATPAP